jgi:serine/threonine protein kinase
LAGQQQTTSNRLRPFKPSQFGRYTLLMPLSVGGMGEIFLARLEGVQGFEKLCVIKKILPHLAEDPDFTSRFVNEARTLVKLTHGSIAQVLDMGLHQGEPYLALEYIDGKDLRKIAARGRERNLPLPLTFVLFTMSRVLDALAYAHRKRDDDEKEIGLVHRDMSPQNILISYEGEVKVIDFGLAKSTLNASKTNPSIILGKFLYMSPEQARHGKVDRRSDLYSVGLCLYELISNKNPFEDVPPHALMAAVANPQIPHVQQAEPLCPSNIAQIIMKALAVDPAQRFQTAEELRGKILACLLDIDPSAGPESASRFMRETFSAEYQAERKLLAQLKESAAKGDAGPIPAAPVGPLRAVKSNPRIEHPPEEEATPSPTDLRKYGLEPTVPRGKPLATPLSFAPTPKVGGSTVSAGERETLPGIVLDPMLRSASRDDDERPTGPHILDPAGGGLLSADVTENIVLQPMAAQVLSKLPYGVEAPLGPEPVTSQIQVTDGPPMPSEPVLPSVMVEGVPPEQPATTQQSTKATPTSALKVPPGKVATAAVLMPASQVRAPEVMAPLPKALERRTPDENSPVTDRGTRSRRMNLVIVLMPLLAVVGLAALVGWTVWLSAERSEEDDPLNNLRNSSKKMTAPSKVLPNPGTESASSQPQDIEAAEPTVDDDVAMLPTAPPKEPVAAPAPAPVKKAPGKVGAIDECGAQLLKQLQTRQARRSIEEKKWNGLFQKALAIANSAKTTPPEMQAQKCRDLREEIQQYVK